MNLDFDNAARRMRQEDKRPLWRKLLICCVTPRVAIAGIRFARTGTVEDYWRHEYYLRGPRGMADLIIHKDKLIAYYCDQAFRLRHGKG